MIDLDHFKRVNDTHGHAMGDEVIRNLARVATASVRETDLVARFGGEELVVVAPHTELGGAAQLAERLRGAFATTEHVLGDVTIRSTASFGVASYEGSGEGPEGLMARADDALYRAKAGGRNRVVVWTAPAPPARILETSK